MSVGGVGLDAAGIAPQPRAAHVTQVSTGCEKLLLLTIDSFYFRRNCTHNPAIYLDLAH
jgi:hypothetical protein